MLQTKMILELTALLSLKVAPANSGILTKFLIQYLNENFCIL